MPDIVHFHRVSHRYEGGHEALVNVNFRLQQGQMVFITGHSGAGKSTLLKLIALIVKPTRGQLIVNGQNLAGIKRRHVPAYRQQIGIIFQNFNLLYDRTVFDNVALPLVIRGFRHEDAAKRARAALDAVGLLGKEKVYPITLSGGEQQRVGIARAIVVRPTLLLADEPTGNLDPGMAREIMQIFERFNKVGVSVLVATHAVDLVSKMGHKMVHLDHGKLVDPEATGELEPHGG